MSMTYHEYTLEINRLEAKQERQSRSLEQTTKLIASLKALRDQGEKKELTGKAR